MRIRKTKEWPANRDAVSLPTFFKKQCESGGDHKALFVKRDGTWKSWTFTQYYETVMTAAKAFIALGLEPHNAVCVYGFNSPEWFFSDIAAICAGGKVKQA